MRKLLVGFSLLSLLSFGVLAAAAVAPTNFAGTWALDKSKSKDLPPQMENIDSYTLTVTQDAQQITVASSMTMAQDANAGGGQGGGRGRGMGGFPPSATYKLDGTETTAEATGAAAAPRPSRPSGRTAARLWC